MLQAFNNVLSRGGVKGFYQGLIPWAWLEASTKGAVLLFASGEIETLAKEKLGAGGAVSGLLGGMGGGVAQAYATMGALAPPVLDLGVRELIARPRSMALRVIRRLLHLHEDGRDHPSQAGRLGCQASRDVCGLYGYLQEGGDQGDQQGSQRRGCQADD